MGAARGGDSRVDVTRAQCAVKPLRLSFPLVINHWKNSQTTDIINT
jgi:hypothetical protein